MITNEIGCISKNSIIEVGTDHHWISKNGMVTLQAVLGYGDVKPIYLSSGIQDEILTFLTSSNASKAFSFYEKLTGKVYVHFRQLDNTIVRYGYDISAVKRND